MRGDRQTDKQTVRQMYWKCPGFILRNKYETNIPWSAFFSEYKMLTAWSVNNRFIFQGLPE